MRKKTCAAGAVQAYLFNAPGETRTPNLLIRSQMLYPIELRAPTSTLVLFDEIRIGPDPTPDPPFYRMLLLLYDERYKTRTCDLHDVNVAL